MTCAICETRRPRRFCPGVRGDLCTICCGTEREVTVNCPLECEYLMEAHRREKMRELDPERLPNSDIRLSEPFIAEHEALIAFLSRCILNAALSISGAVDTDVRDALESLIKTYRTLQSGVYYESRPENSLAIGIYSAAQEAIARFREEEAREIGMPRTRDADVLGALVFLQRLEADRENGRPRGRAFLSLLRNYYHEETGSGSDTGSTGGSSLILP